MISTTSSLYRRALQCLMAGAMMAASIAMPSAGLAETPASVQRSQASLQTVTTYEFLDKLAAYHGKVILVNFFAEYCGPCRMEIPELMKMRKEFSEEDLIIIGVAVDMDIRQAEPFVKEMGVADVYPVYYGGAELARAYRVGAIPFNVVYNRKGHIEASEAGFIPSEDMKRFLTQVIAR